MYLSSKNFFTSANLLSFVQPLGILCRSFHDIDVYTTGFPRGDSQGHPNIFRAVKHCVPGPVSVVKYLVFLAGFHGAIKFFLRDIRVSLGMRGSISMKLRVLMTSWSQGHVFRADPCKIGAVVNILFVFYLLLNTALLSPFVIWQAIL